MMIFLTVMAVLEIYPVSGRSEPTILRPELFTVQLPSLPVNDSIITFKKNGGWCWYQDPRAVIQGDFLVFGSVATVDRDGSEAGDIEVTSYRYSSSAELKHFKLHPQLQPDDHNVPAFLLLPDASVSWPAT